MIEGLIAKFLATRLGAMLPAWAWKMVAAAALLLGGYVYHQHRMHVHDAALVKAAIAAEDQRIAAAASRLTKAADTLTTAIAAEERKKNDEDNRRIAAAADDLRLRGPGRAACSDRAVVPAATGRPRPASGTGDAPVAQVPDAAGLELVGMPFADAVSFSEDHDADRAEVIRWRSWYPKMVAAWDKLAGELGKARKSAP